MNRFFEDSVGASKFTLFGEIHIISIIIMILIMFLLFRYRERIRKWKHHDGLMRYLIAGIMFLNMTVYYGLKLYTNTWDYRVHLPLHFCFISGYLFMYALITNNKKMFRYIYFFSFAGPLPAILLPDLECGIDRYIFWQFVISHHFFIVSSSYCLFVLKWDIVRKDAWDALVKANLIFLAVFIFNVIFHTNYIMTSSLPAHVLGLMPFLAYVNMPIILLEMAGIGAWLVAYIPVYLLHYQSDVLV